MQSRIREFPLWRIFARSTPGKQACRSPSGKCEPSDLRRRVRFLVRVTGIEKGTTSVVPYSGDSYGNLLCLARSPQETAEQCCEPSDLRRRVRFLVRVTGIEKDTTSVVSYSGDSYGNRTHVTAVKGPCLNRLTNEPGSECRI